MKPIAALTLGFFGLVTSIFAVSSEQTNGKLTLGDPIPEVTAQDCFWSSTDSGVSRDSTGISFQGRKARLVRHESLDG